MKKYTIFLLIFVFGGLAGYFFAGYRDGQGDGLPPGCFEHLLTIRRSDYIPDSTTINNGSANVDLLGFTITNRSTSTPYTFKLPDFSFFPGIGNDFSVTGVRRLQLYSGSTKIGEVSVLGQMAIVSSTPPVIIGPGMSIPFTLKADISSSSSATSTLRVAIGRVSAAEANSGRPELVYKETDGRELLPPTTPTDDSIESALFIVLPTRRGR